MRRTFSAGVCLLLVFSVSGCSNTSKHEAVLKNMLEQMNALTDALGTVKDKASAKAAAAKIIKGCDRLEELGKEAEGLPKLNKEENEKLMNKYEPEIKKAQERVIDATTRAGSASGKEEDFDRALSRLPEIGKDLQKIGWKK